VILYNTVFPHTAYYHSVNCLSGTPLEGGQADARGQSPASHGRRGALAFTASDQVGTASEQVRGVRARSTAKAR